MFLSRLVLFHKRHPTNPLIAREWRKALPCRLRRTIGSKSLPNVRGHIVHRSRCKRFLHHTLRLPQNLFHRLPLRQLVYQFIEITNFAHDWLFDVLHPHSANNTFNQQSRAAPFHTSRGRVRIFDRFLADVRRRSSLSIQQAKRDQTHLAQKRENLRNLYLAEHSEGRL